MKPTKSASAPSRASRKPAAKGAKGVKSVKGAKAAKAVPVPTTVGIGQRQTRPRGAIVALLNAAPGPLTVPEIHAQAQQAEPGAKIGIATVYRTLNLLVENGLAQHVLLPSGESRYEAAGHKGHHDHFQCVQCARVFDIDTCQLGLPAGALIAGGFRVQGHELTLTGLCPDCDTPVAKRRARAS